MEDYQTAITILGSAGGVGKSILSILNKSVIDGKDPIHHMIKSSRIHLIDNKQREESYYTSLFPNLKDQIALHQFDLKDTTNLKNHLKTSNTSVVMDISLADTLEMLQCCDQLGINYVNTAVGNTMVDESEDLYEGFTLIEKMKIIDKKKNIFSNSSAIIGSGMNPGVVQWMAIELLKGDSSEDIPIGCYIVEHDTTFYKNKKFARENVIYTSWSPAGFLEEAVLSYPMFMKHRNALFLYENVYDIEFKVTLGDKQFYGCLMPHEEVFTLGQLFDMECGFLYKINDHTSEIIRSNMANVDKLRDYEMKVLDPLEAALEGEDLAGVLLVYHDKERYMYNVSRNDTSFSQYKLNATYLQVACGVYASLAVLLLDQIPKGAYYVDELLLKTENNYGKYLTYYMTDFVIGENKHSDGLLLERIKKRT